MAKKIKKVDVKKVEKLEVSTLIRNLFEEMGITVGSAEDYGFTEGSLVLAMPKCDVQVKIITPKAGIDRYDVITEEEEEEEVKEDEQGEEVKEDEQGE